LSFLTVKKLDNDANLCSELQGQIQSDGQPALLIKICQLKC
jgi:hypothetical protein